MMNITEASNGTIACSKFPKNPLNTKATEESSTAQRGKRLLNLVINIPCRMNLTTSVTIIHRSFEFNRVIKAMIALGNRTTWLYKVNSATSSAILLLSYVT